MATITMKNTKSAYETEVPMETKAAPSDEKQNAAIITDIVEMAYGRDVQGIEEHLDHEDWRVRVAAVRGLGYVGDSRVLIPLVRVWKDDKDERVRTEAREIASIVWQQLFRRLRYW